MQTKTLRKRILEGKAFGENGDVLYTQDAIDLHGELRRRRKVTKRMRKSHARTALHR